MDAGDRHTGVRRANLRGAVAGPVRMPSSTATETIVALARTADERNFNKFH